MLGEDLRGFGEDPRYRETTLMVVLDEVLAIQSDPMRGSSLKDSRTFQSGSTSLEIINIPVRR